MAHQMSEDEDEARAALENIRLEAGRSLRERDPADREGRYLLHLSVQAMGHVHAALSAANDGDLWAAVRSALLAGIVEGHQQAYPMTYHERRKREALESGVRAQREAGRAVGKANRGRRKVNDIVRERIVRQYHLLRAKNTALSAKEACRRVGKDFDVAGVTVRRYVGELDAVAKAFGA